MAPVETEVAIPGTADCYPVWIPNWLESAVLRPVWVTCLTWFGPYPKNYSSSGPGIPFLLVWDLWEVFWLESYVSLWFWWKAPERNKENEETEFCWKKERIRKERKKERKEEKRKEKKKEKKKERKNPALHCQQEGEGKRGRSPRPSGSISIFNPF